MLKTKAIESKFTERQLFILENAFRVKEDYLNELDSIKFNVDEHRYEESWINGQGNEPIEYLEEVAEVREILNELSEDDGKALYQLLMERKIGQELEVAE